MTPKTPTRADRERAFAALYPEQVNDGHLSGSVRHWIEDGIWVGSRYLVADSVAQAIAEAREEGREGASLKQLLPSDREFIRWCSEARRAAERAGCKGFV